MTFIYTNSKDRTYYLHKREIALKNGRIQPIHYFAKEINETTALETVPVGYQVSESKKGLPILKKA